MVTFLSLAQHINEIGEIAEATPRPLQPKPQQQKKKLIQETFRTFSETQQRKQLTIKKFLYLISKI